MPGAGFQPAVLKFKPFRTVLPDVVIELFPIYIDLCV
jgi:hypothetical protein